MRALAWLLVLLTICFGVCAGQAQPQCQYGGGSSGLKCLWQLLLEIPELSLIAANLNSSQSLADRVYSCKASEPLTLFSPINSAVIQAVTRVLKRAKSTQSNQSLSQTSIGELWSRSARRLDAANANAGAKDALTEMGVDGVLRAYLHALENYHVTTGNFSADKLAPVQLLNTSLVNDDPFVLLGNGVPQRLLVVNAPSNASNGKDGGQHSHTQDSLALLKLQKNCTFANATSKVVFGDGQYLFANDAKVITPNIRAIDGVIHIIDKVLDIPANTTTLLQAANLTYFYKLIHLAGVSQLLNNQKSLTVFAPTNAALLLLDRLIGNRTGGLFNYRALSQRVLTARQFSPVREELPNLCALPKQELINLIKLHVFNSTVYSTDFLLEPAMVSVNGTRFNVTANSGNGGTRSKALRFDSLRKQRIHLSHEAKNASAHTFKIGNATIVFANILTRNGVIHVIDGVIGVNISTHTAAPLPPLGTVNVSAAPLEPLPQPTGLPTSTQTPWVIPEPYQIPMSATIQSGIGCINNTGMAIFLHSSLNATNFTLIAPDGNRSVVITGPRTCGTGLRMCYVAALSKSCAVSDDASGIYQWSMATPSQVNAKYTGQIEFISSCYDPKAHVCVDNHFICPVTHPALCGDACYAPSAYRCFTSFNLCPASAPSLCGAACYNSQQYACQQGRITPLNPTPHP